MLNLLAVFLVCSGIGIAVHIAIDLTHRPQSMKIMNAVWILTALWGSYLALWAYNKFGQGAPMKMGGGEMKMDMSGMKDMNIYSTPSYSKSSNIPTSSSSFNKSSLINLLSFL